MVEMTFVPERDFEKKPEPGTVTYTTAGSSARMYKIYGRADWVFDTVAEIRNKAKATHEPMYGHMVPNVKHVYVENSGARDMRVTVIMRKNDYAGD